MAPERHYMLMLMLLLLPALAAGMALLRSDTTDESGSLWSDYRDTFIHDGRVIDTGNQNISHTEGQGWALLMAEYHDDRDTFEALWGWTLATLYDRHSNLFSWRYRPGDTPPVSDPNNATDGDLLIAWALLRASLRWEDPAHITAATHLREAIRRHLVREQAGYTILLPGKEGFVHKGHRVINLSYLVMPALRDFAALEPDGPWQRLMDDGRKLLDQGRFGEHALPPDWLALDDEGQLSPATGWPPRFAYEGVRIPLYFVWAGERDLPALVAINAFWNQTQPAWVDVMTGATAEYGLSRGGQAIAALLAGSVEAMPAEFSVRRDYYSSSLLLLTHMALAESL